MPSLNDLNPADISQVIAPTSGPLTGNILSEHPDNVRTPEQYKSDIYSTPGQQLLAGLEGAGQGAIGPLAPAIERFSGLTTSEDIRARQEENPVAHGAGEVTGFVGSQFVPGLGEANVARGVGAVGHAAEAVTHLIPQVPKLISTGVKAGAELTALAASDELSKMVLQDPNQTLGTAAVNIGLSGLIGGAGGATLGLVSPLFKTTANRLGISKLANDFMGETKFLQDTPNVAEGAKQELTSRLAEAENMRNVLSETKPELIARALP